MQHVTHTLPDTSPRYLQSDGAPRCPAAASPACCSSSPRAAGPAGPLHTRCSAPARVAEQLDDAAARLAELEAFAASRIEAR